MQFLPSSTSPRFIYLFLWPSRIHKNNIYQYKYIFLAINETLLMDFAGGEGDSNLSCNTIIKYTCMVTVHKT